MLVSAIGKLNTFNRGYVKSQTLICPDKKDLKANTSGKDSFVKVYVKSN